VAPPSGGGQEATPCADLTAPEQPGSTVRPALDLGLMQHGRGHAQPCARCAVQRNQQVPCRVLAQLGTVGMERQRFATRSAPALRTAWGLGDRVSRETKSAAAGQTKPAQLLRSYWTSAALVRLIAMAAGITDSPLAGRRQFCKDRRDGTGV